MERRTGQLAGSSPHGGRPCSHGTSWGGGGRGEGRGGRGGVTASLERKHIHTMLAYQNGIFKSFLMFYIIYTQTKDTQRDASLDLCAANKRSPLNRK